MLFWPLLSNESESNESCPVFSGKQKGAATNQRKVKQPSEPSTIRTTAAWTQQH